MPLQLLDHLIRVLANGPLPRESPVARLLLLSQRHISLPAFTDLQRKPALPGERFAFQGVIGRISIQFIFRSVQQLAHPVFRQGDRGND